MWGSLLNMKLQAYSLLKSLQLAEDYICLTSKCDYSITYVKPCVMRGYSKGITYLIDNFVLNYIWSKEGSVEPTLRYSYAFFHWNKLHFLCYSFRTDNKYITVQSELQSFESYWEDWLEMLEIRATHTLSILGNLQQ